MSEDRSYPLGRRTYLTLAGGACVGLAGCSGDRGTAADGEGAQPDAEPTQTDAETTQEPTPTTTAGTPTESETETAAETEPGPTQTSERGSTGPSEPHSSVPIYPGATTSMQALGVVDFVEQIRIPDAFERSGYVADAPPADVAKWYGSGRDGWEKDYRRLVQGQYLLTYTKGDTTAIVLALSNQMGSGTMLVIASGLRSHVFAGPPPLGHLGVDIGSYDPATGHAGGFDFDALQATKDDDDVPIAFFGDTLSSGTKINPTFEYYPAEDADVYAAIDGVVDVVEKNSNYDDYTVQLTPESGFDTCYVDHDHVLDPVVSEDDVVVAGDRLGTVGLWAIDGVGRTEVQVSNSFGPHYCPLTNVVDGKRTTLEGNVHQLVSEWDDATGDDTGSTNFVYPGCVKETWLESG